MGGGSTGFRSSHNAREDLDFAENKQSEEAQLTLFFSSSNTSSLRMLPNPKVVGTAVRAICQRRIPVHLQRSKGTKRARVFDKEPREKKIERQGLTFAELAVELDLLGTSGHS